VGEKMATPSKAEDGSSSSDMWKTVAAFSVFLVGNVSLNYFNQWALHDSPTNFPGHGKGGFNFPFFYTMFHMAASCLAAYIMQLTCTKPKDGVLPHFGQFWAYKHVLLPISVLTLVNNGFNNASLGSVALYVNQVIKATAPLPTSFFEWVFMGKLYNLKIYGTITVIVAGSILANADSFSRGGSSQSSGIIMCLISMLAATIKPVVQKISMTGGGALNPFGGSCGDCCRPTKTDPKDLLPPLSPSQTLFWDTGIAFWLFMAVWLINERERTGSIAYLSGGYMGNENSGLLGLGIISFGSFLAFIFNIAMYYYILYTSALTSTIGSNGIKIFLIVISAITEDGDRPPLTWIGIATVSCAIAIYGYFSFQFKQEQDAKVKAAADEKTPLSSVSTRT